MDACESASDVTWFECAGKSGLELEWESFNFIRHQIRDLCATETTEKAWGTLRSGGPC